MTYKELSMAVISFLPNVLLVYGLFLLYQIGAGQSIRYKRTVLGTMTYAVLYTLLFDLPVYLFPNQLSGLHQFFLENFAASALFMNLTNWLMFVGMLYLFIDKDMKCCLFLGAVTWSGYEMVFYVINHVIDLLAKGQLYVYLFVSFLSIFPIYLLMKCLYRKMDIPKLVEAFRRKNYSYPVVIAMSIGAALTDVLVQVITPFQKGGYRWGQMILLLLILTAAYLVIKHLFVRMQESEQLRYDQMLLNQQELYIRDLEDAQQNLRTLKHDYKNMMTALYLQAEEESYDEIRQNLQSMMEDFDANIEYKMNLTSQLANLQHSELKSLLFQKITEIHKKKIPFRLEILEPVRVIPVEKMDLVRIMGVLLDNAIEATEENQGDIVLLMTQEAHVLTVIVDNYVSGDMDLSLIYREGYATKENHSAWV